jgi:hypothetical protein
MVRGYYASRWQRRKKLVQCEGIIRIVNNGLLLRRLIFCITLFHSALWGFVRLEGGERFKRRLWLAFSV